VTERPHDEQVVNLPFDDVDLERVDEMPSFERIPQEKCKTPIKHSEKHRKKPKQARASVRTSQLTRRSYKNNDLVSLGTKKWGYQDKTKNLHTMSGEYKSEHQAFLAMVSIVDSGAEG
jgi:hypothetical protein